MHLITFAPLRISGSTVRVEWTVEPATPLYRHCDFTLDFGSALDPRTLPLKVCWTAVLLCLHSQWNLLRPCRVVLPVLFPEGEIEFWSRLLDSERIVLEKYRGTADFARNVELVCLGQPFSTAIPPVTNGRAGEAFSGGKDSLSQAGLLCELAPPALLVNTLSPMPPQLDHVFEAREWVLTQMALRRECQVVVVKSDLRSTWENDFPSRLGYRHTVNELSDVFLYTANLMLVAASRGVEYIFQAAQLRFNQVDYYHDQLLQNYHFNAAPITQHSLDRLFRQWGLHYGSLITGLSNFQTQQLICQRYADLRELQSSCWSMQKKNQRYCSRCRKCLQVAAVRLALGLDPAEIGLDLERLFRAPIDLSGGSVDTIEYAMARIDLARVQPFFPKQSWLTRLRRPSAYSNLRIMVEQDRTPVRSPVVQRRPQYDKWIPARFATRIDEIYREYWQEEDPTDYSDNIARVDRGVRWITAPLDNR